jgi:hypothetical protein
MLVLADGESFSFDACLEETHDGTATVTSNPVERGSAITDHVRQDPKTYTVRGVITNTPITAAGRGGVYQSKPLLVKYYEAPLEPTTGSLLNAGGNAIKGAVGSLLGTTPREAAATVLTFPTPFNAPREAEALLDAWQKDATLLTIFTKVRTYENMVLASKTVTAQTTDSVEIQITFQEIRIVTPKTVSAPLPTIPRAKKKVDKGTQGKDTPPDPKVSVLKKGVDALKGMIAK